MVRLVAFNHPMSLGRKPRTPRAAIAKCADRPPCGAGQRERKGPCRLRKRAGLEFSFRPRTSSRFRPSSVSASSPIGFGATVSLGARLLVDSRSGLPSSPHWPWFAVLLTASPGGPRGYAAAVSMLPRGAALSRVAPGRGHLQPRSLVTRRGSRSRWPDPANRPLQSRSKAGGARRRW